MSPRLPLITLTLLGLGVTAHAAPKAPTVSPAAKALLTQMAAAENALTSYSGTITISDNGHKSQAVIKVKKPDDVSVTASAGGTPQAEAVSDGVNFSTVDYGQKKYVQQAASGNGQDVGQALQASRSLLATLIAQPATLTVLTQDTHTLSVALGLPSTAGGDPVQTVVAKVSPEQGVVETLSFEIGQSDHLLRGLEFTAAQAGHTMTHTETLTDFQVNPALTAADFTFTPPAGLTKVASAQDMQPAMYDARLTVGADPLPVAATDLSGKPVSLDAYKGKVVMLDFWATWCPPCRGEIPNIVAAYGKYHAQGFDIVGVSLDQPNDRAGLEKFLVQNHMTWRQVYDGGYWQSALAKQYGVQSIPFSVLIGKDGKIAALGDAMRGPGLAPAIQAALAQK